MKDKIVQFLFYVLYLFCGLLMVCSFLTPEPIGAAMYVTSILVSVIIVVAEADYFRPRWPVEGTRDYEQIVMGFQNSMREGIEQHYRNERKRLDERMAEKKNQGARNE